MAHPQNSIGIQIWVVHPLPHLQPGVLSSGQANLQPSSIQTGDVGPQGMEQGFHLGGAQTVNQWMAEEGLQGALVLAFHRTGSC